MGWSLGSRVNIPNIQWFFPQVFHLNILYKNQDNYLIITRLEIRRLLSGQKLWRPVQVLVVFDRRVSRDLKQTTHGKQRIELFI